MNRTNLMKLQKNRLFEEHFAKNVLIILMGMDIYITINKNLRLSILI